MISLVLGAAACGARSDLLEPSEGTIGDGSEDAAVDAGSDARVDARADAGSDGGPDAHVAPDAAADAGEDATDAPADAVPDVVEEPAPDASPSTLAGFAVSPYALYGFELPSGAVATIGPTSRPLFDIARLPDGTLYGIDQYGDLDTVDVATGNETTGVQVEAPGGVNALGAAPDGTLYAANTSGVLYTIDPQTGAAAEVLTYPDALESSGDLAVLGGVLYATATNLAPGVNDSLIAVDLASSSATIVGTIGFQCVWGLAFDGVTLYGFTCDGQVITIDTASAAGTMVTSGWPSFYGASSL